MPFREKTAWLMLVSMIVSYGAYFTVAAMNQPSDPAPDWRFLVYFAAASALRVLILGAGYAAIRAASPQEARAKPDEWDRAIGRRSAAIAYYVLMAGVAIAGVILPFRAQGWAIVNASLAAIVIAEMVYSAMVIASYRRGWKA